MSVAKKWVPGVPGGPFYIIGFTNQWRAHYIIVSPKILNLLCLSSGSSMSLLCLLPGCSTSHAVLFSRGQGCQMLIPIYLNLSMLECDINNDLSACTTSCRPDRFSWPWSTFH